MEIIEGMVLGVRTPEWGHTWITKGAEKYYTLRSLAEGSRLVVCDAAGGILGEWETPGRHSCFVRVCGSRAVVCDYTGGSMGVWSLDAEGLPAGEVQMRYFEPCSHIHSCWEAPSDGALIVADLGADRLYRFQPELNSYETFETPQDCGPRHCAFGRDRLYVSTELSDEVLVLEYPSMRLLQRCTVNPEHPSGGAHLALSPDGRFLYVSSRLSNDGVAVFAVGADGLLSGIGYQRTGLHPRHFSLRPDGLEMAVACRDSAAVEFYDIDPSSGLLSPGGRCPIKIDNPVFVEYEQKDRL